MLFLYSVSLGLCEPRRYFLTPANMVYVRSLGASEVIQKEAATAMETFWREEEDGGSSGGGSEQQTKGNAAAAAVRKHRGIEKS